MATATTVNRIARTMTPSTLATMMSVRSPTRNVSFHPWPLGHKDTVNISDVHPVHSSRDQRSCAIAHSLLQRFCTARTTMTVAEMSTSVAYDAVATGFLAPIRNNNPALPH